MNVLRRASIGIVALALALAGIAATPKPAAASWERTLSVTFAFGENLGDGAGRVTSDDGGIDCTYSGYNPSGDCSEHYVFPNFSTSYDVTLTFDPNTGSVACTNITSGCAPRGQNASLPIHFDLGSGGDVTVKGSFSLDFVQVEVNYDGPGTVSSNAQFPCTPSSGNEACFVYKYSNSVTLTAHPDSGYPFSFWLGSPCESTAGTSSTCSFTVTGDLDVTAVFGKVPLTIHRSTGGYVCEYGGTLCLAEGQSSLRVYRVIGTTQWFDANEEPGYTFDHWNTGPCAGKTVRCSFTLTGATDLTATFRKLATPAPSAKPTPKPTPKPSTAPGATEKPPPTLAPGATPGPSPEPTFTPTNAPGGTDDDIASSDPGGTPSTTGVPPAPPSAQPSVDPVVDPSGTGGTTDVSLMLLFVVAAVVVAGLGFFLGRRTRSTSRPTER